MIEPVNHQSSLGFSAKEEINRGPSCVVGDMRALSVSMIRDVKRKIRTMMKSNAMVGANVQYVRFRCKCAKRQTDSLSSFGRGTRPESGTVGNIKEGLAKRASPQGGKAQYISYAAFSRIDLRSVQAGEDCPAIQVSMLA